MPTIKLTLQTGGWTSPQFQEVEVEWDPEGDALSDLLATRITSRKEEATCILPCALKGGKNNVTRSGRRRVTDADGGTCLVFDLDYGDLDAGIFEAALTRLKVAAAYWPTWQAGSRGMRWRILIPLASMVATTEYEALWTTWARAIEHQLAKETGSRREGGWIDWQARSVTQPAILPCRPEIGTGSEAYPWGGRTPNVVHVDGDVLVPGTKPPGRAQGAPKTFESKARPLAPYVASSTSQRGQEVVELLEKGTFATPAPLAALDGVARLRVEGIRAERGGRHACLSSAIWTLYRLGCEPDEWLNAAEEIISATGSVANRRHLEKKAPSLVEYHHRHAADAEVLATKLVQGANADRGVPRVQVPALRRDARVLARAAHLRTEKGGKLDHDALARITGIDVRVLTAWRHRMIDARLVSQSGTERDRRYRVLATVGGVVGLDMDRVLEHEMEVANAS